MTLGRNFPISCIVEFDSFVSGFVGYLAAYSDNIHRARSPRSVSIWPYRCFPRRRSVSQVGISIHSSRPGAVTASGVTAAEMYGNCTRLTYRLRVARGLSKCLLVVSLAQHPPADTRRELARKPTELTASLPLRRPLGWMQPTSRDVEESSIVCLRDILALPYTCIPWKR